MGSVASADRYRFGAFELQLDERRLLRDGAAVPLRPRAFDLLAAFVDRAGHRVTKDELLDRVWPGVVVEKRPCTCRCRPGARFSATKRSPLCRGRATASR